MERFCTPNLPSSRVRKAFISQIMPDELVSELVALGLTPYKLGFSENLESELKYHPDVLVNNFRKGQWMCEYNAKYIPVDIPRKIFIESERILDSFYPYDCLFNNFIIGNVLFCGNSSDNLIKAYAEYQNIRIAALPQNYVKCCSVLVNEQAVITCDPYIGRALRENGFDVLTISDCDNIGLRGYSHGLIGGCAGLLSKDLLGFTGDLNKLRQGDDIRDFCANHNVDAFSLSSNPMYDYGGILPITELVPKDEELFSDSCGF